MKIEGEVGDLISRLMVYSTQPGPAEHRSAMAKAAELLSARSSAQLPGALWLAKWFHDTYEALAPEYGYEKRPETRVFSSSTPNGKLMIAVCEKLRLAMNSRR